MPKVCIGYIDGTPCCFGDRPGTKKRIEGERCNFCDPNLLKAALLTRLTRQKLVKHFKKLREDLQAKVIERLPHDVVINVIDFAAGADS